MATTSSLEPKPVIIALPDIHRKQIHIVLRQPVPEVRAGCEYLYQDVVP